jgi:hypothetical protein
MQKPRAWPGTGVVNGKIYVFGATGVGRDAVASISTEEYDPVTDTWTFKSDMPAVVGPMAASSVNDLIYIFGGGNVSTGPHSAVSMYNPIPDIWSPLSQMPTARGLAHASEVNRNIYVIGGNSTGFPFTPIATVEEYNPHNDPVTGVTDKNDVSPDRFVLHQNYPNPFNPETIIQYQMPQRSEVNLVIFSLLGQRVTTLVDEVQSTGIYSVQWDGKDDTGKEVASGVYLYRLQTEQFVQVKKLALLR